MRLWKLAVGLCASVALAGCSTAIPDLSAYGTATGKLRSDSVAVYKSTQQCLDHLAQQQEAATQAAAERAHAAGATPQDAALENTAREHERRLEAIRSGFAGVVQARGLPLDGFVAYTAALERTARAAASEQAKAKEVQAAFQSLVASVNTIVPNPVLGASADGIDAVAAMLGQARQVQIAWKATRTMAAAMEAADPAVEKLVAAMQLDLANLGEVLDSTALGAMTTRKLVSEARFGEAAKAVARQRRDADAQARSAAVSNGGPLGSAVLDAVEAQESLAERLVALSGGAEAAALQEEVRAAKAALLEASAALTAWRQAHKEVAASVRDGLSPSVAGLAASVEALSKAVDEVRKAGVELRKIRRERQH